MPLNCVWQCSYLPVTESNSNNLEGRTLVEGYLVAPTHVTRLEEQDYNTAATLLHSVHDASSPPFSLVL